MRRIRIVFALVTLALLVPGGLLVRRALEAVEVERQARHRTVAERVFDEMERWLSDFLREEEERPVGHYRFYVTPDGHSAPAGERSPLSGPGERDFVLGHFQVDPNGSVHTPLRPRDPELAALRGDDPGWRQNSEAADAVVRLAAAHWSAPAPGRAEEVAPAERAQAPGTTVDLAEPVAEAESASGLDAVAGFADEEVAAYDALRSLNRAASDRVDRRRKLAQKSSAVEERALEVQMGLAAESKDEGKKPSEQRPAKRLDAAEAPAPRVAATLASPTEAGPAARSSAPAGFETEPPAIPPAPVVDPMIGRRLDAQHLMLSRTVLARDGGLRQGLVVELPRLVDTLRSGVLERAALRGAEIHFEGVDEPASPGLDSYRYRHRFAEPFDALSVELRLAALGDTAGAGTVYGLSLLLLLAGAVGLFSLYRMVAVAVGFSERRSNFVAAVTHELKTPLTAIRMYGEMLRDGIVPTEEKRAEYYRTITTESERLSRLIDNVLEFSRLEKGTREMHLVVGDLGPAVEEAADWLRPHAERMGFALELELEPGLPAVRFDRDALVQVIFNLVDNALKYARDATSREVGIACRRRDGGVALTVRDHGPGVAPRHLPRLFDAFYRGETELTRSTQGTGIGLALVKSLSERMGAAISGRNARSGGFEVRLDFREAEAP